LPILKVKQALVSIFSTTGHTFGHQILSINLQEYGPTILSEDLLFCEKAEVNALSQALVPIRT